MKVSKTFEGQAARIFQGIVLSFQQDYYQATNIELSEGDIQPGLTYIKHFGKNNQNSIKITVIEFESPQKYAVEYSSNQGKHFVSYELKDLDESHVEITYYQYHQTEGIFQKLNAKLMNIFFKNATRRKIEAQLKGLVSFASTLA